MPLTMKLINSVLVYLLGTGSGVDRANAEASDAVKIASKVILFGKQIYETEIRTESYWVYKDEIYFCNTAFELVVEADGSTAPRPAIYCVPQFEEAKLFVKQADLKAFKELNDNALWVLYEENAPVFSSMKLRGITYTFHAASGTGALYVCTTRWKLLVCRYNDDLTDFDILF